MYAFPQQQQQLAAEACEEKNTCAMLHHSCAGEQNASQWLFASTSNKLNVTYFSKQSQLALIKQFMTCSIENLQQKQIFGENLQSSM